jgi:hypothetical protein
MDLSNEIESDDEQAEQADMVRKDVYRLEYPVTFGSELIESVQLKPTGRVMRDFKLRIGADGSMEMDIFKLAELALKMAGKPSAVLDKMDPLDITGLSMLVLAFIMPGLKTGKTASP